MINKPLPILRQPLGNTSFFCIRKGLHLVFVLLSNATKRRDYWDLSPHLQLHIYTKSSTSYSQKSEESMGHRIWLNPINKINKNLETSLHQLGNPPNIWPGNSRLNSIRVQWVLFTQLCIYLRPQISPRLHPLHCRLLLASTTISPDIQLAKSRPSCHCSSRSRRQAAEPGSQRWPTWRPKSRPRLDPPRTNRRPYFHLPKLQSPHRSK